MKISSIIVVVIIVVVVNVPNEMDYNDGVKVNFFLFSLVAAKMPMLTYTIYVTHTNALMNTYDTISMQNTFSFLHKIYIFFFCKTAVK